MWAGLPPRELLAEYHIPEPMRLGLRREEKPAGREHVPQAREAAPVELQARAGIYRQDDVETGPFQALEAITRRPLAGRSPGISFRQKREPRRLFGICACRQVGNRNARLCQSVEDAPRCAAA